MYLLNHHDSDPRNYHTEENYCSNELNQFFQHSCISNELMIEYWDRRGNFFPFPGLNQALSYHLYDG